MTTTAVTHIASLVTNDPSLGNGTPLGLIQDAAVVIDGDRIVWTGESSKAPATDNVLDAAGRAMIPGFVDSHSHLVFAGDRTQEFNARMSGQPYTAGGIRTTVAATREASDEQLSANVAHYLAEALRQGTTTLETKSGYGLTVEDEARALRIASRHTDEVTYLGAHVVSPDYADDPAGYVDLVTG
ncbi:imidazolonepropionase, partial [Streptomyces cavourensis]|nr:imidazolonepropionase [Streptomyces cavourensis]